MKRPLRCCAVLLLLAGCGAEEPDSEFRIAGPPPHPLSGIWHGTTPSVSDSQYDHDTTIVHRYIGAVDPNATTGSYEYFNLDGFTCRSDLDFRAQAGQTYIFDDVTQTQGCLDGTVTLTLTADPNIIEFEWLELNGTLQNSGDLERVIGPL
ncbi:MAG: hypothetical protein AAF721_20830 [Myxococcota bacterium]